MAKNLIPEICKMLGVEVGEEFKIRDEVGVMEELLFIDERGALLFAHSKLKIGGYFRPKTVTLENLLSGYAEIIKLPWKPKCGEYYWTFEYDIDTVNNEPLITWHVSHNPWRNAPDDFAKFDKGWVYRTHEEAETALPKVAEELGVEYEL